MAGFILRIHAGGFSGTAGTIQAAGAPTIAARSGGGAPSLVTSLPLGLTASVVTACVEDDSDKRFCTGRTTVDGCNAGAGADRSRAFLSEPIGFIGQILVRRRSAIGTPSAARTRSRARPDSDRARYAVNLGPAMDVSLQYSGGRLTDPRMRVAWPVDPEPRISGR